MYLYAVSESIILPMELIEVLGEMFEAFQMLVRSRRHLQVN